ncbi:MAG: ABC transporter permease [bacterium]|nr:ABC transporter permease [bacterium]
MNKIFPAIKMALRSMNANKMRTFLTVLGVMIGIASIIIVYSAGEGIRSLMVGQMEAFGTNIIETEVKVPTAKKGTSGDTESAMALASGVQVTTLNGEDLKDINKIPNIIGGYGAVMAQEKITFKNESRAASLFGVSATYLDIDKSKMASGFFFSAEDDQVLSQSAVLGSKIKETLFGDSDPLGQYITIRKARFRVIGVMASRGATMGLDLDSYVYVPVRTLQQKIMGTDYFMYMIHQFQDPKLAADTAEEIKRVVRDNHGITDPAKDDFRVTTMEEMMKMLDTVTNALTWLLLAIVAISLIVGGVGILNIMYVIVSERTLEIGLRKAVGANYSHIMTQFLVEAVLITLLGAVIGVILGVVVSKLIAVGAGFAGLAWEFRVPLKAFAVSISFAFLFGIFFGVYPAKKAAQMNPIDALRKE